MIAQFAAPLKRKPRRATIPAMNTQRNETAGRDPILLEVYKSLLSAAAEEMGLTLQRSAFSPNIKERRDFSCALFNADGKMTAQAAHIPVHLGAMPLSVKACLDAIAFEPGDAAILNDPYQGGTHLPDVTLVTPVFLPNETRPFAFAASRAHHADIGGMSPGSMPLSREIYQEGLIIPPMKIAERGKRNENLWRLLLANTRTPDERGGDLNAQIAANQIGTRRLIEIADRRGKAETETYMNGLLEYSERMTRALIEELPDGIYACEDRLDEEDGAEPARIAAAVTIRGGEAVVDFSGTSEQQPGNVNAVYAIAVSAAHYAFLSLLAPGVPVNAGSCAPIEVRAPEGSVVNARRPAAVAAGNVETSQRIVDALLGALAKAAPHLAPAASQGTMNNLTVGGTDPRGNRPYAYYETVGGGAGAGPKAPGEHAVHTHMTNTMNTPVEALEYAYPLRVTEYAVRKGSGGAGRQRGGDGIVREIELLGGAATATLLAESRKRPPYGLQGGKPGKTGEDSLIRNGKKTRIPGKTEIQLKKGDRLRIETPGGGGFGAE